MEDLTHVMKGVDLPKREVSWVQQKLCIYAYVFLYSHAPLVLLKTTLGGGGQGMTFPSSTTNQPPINQPNQPTPPACPQAISHHEGATIHDFLPL